MPHPTRQAIAKWAATALLIVAVAYPLSYAPYNRLRYGPFESVNIMSYANGEIVPDDSADFSETFYAPVDWLIDHTLFEMPLLCWADSWGAVHHHRALID
jgi:hypothetical protein